MDVVLGVLLAQAGLCVILCSRPHGCPCDCAVAGVGAGAFAAVTVFLYAQVLAYKCGVRREVGGDDWRPRHSGGLGIRCALCWHLVWCGGRVCGRVGAGTDFSKF